MNANIREVPDKAKAEAPAEHERAKQVLKDLWTRTDILDPAAEEVSAFKKSLTVTEKVLAMMEKLGQATAGRLSSGLRITIEQLEAHADQLERVHAIRKDLR